jgi:hypothetical protein
MTWEQKTEMVKFSNTNDEKSFINHVLTYLDSFDEQDWDMYLNCVVLTRESLQRFLPQHKIIHKHESLMQYQSFRTAMRSALYESLMYNLEHNLLPNS